jgi:aryl-alcohol dehydrogenase-like predicted oxidoreductase
MDKTKKLALGTAQFGLPYGVVNQSGQIPNDEIKQILETAGQADVTTLDTAIAYGESERVLGLQDLRKFSVITKLPSVPDGCSNVTDWVQEQFHASLERLRLKSLDGLLLHRPGQLLEPIGHELYQAMLALRQQGLVRRIGISVYGTEELEALLDSYQFDLVQAPFNLLDKRLSKSGWFERFDRSGTALHVRSVFMQGLLLIAKKDRPTKFERWGPLWAQWEQWLNDTGQTPLEACLRHALAVPQIERIVVGVDSISQWNDILSACEGPVISPPESLACNDIELLNPSFWNHL